MTRRVGLAEYRALAEMRVIIRRYLQHSEDAVRAAGLAPQWYMAMLQLRGLPAGSQPTIRTLADRMQLRHNSVVELVNRLEKRGLLRREPARHDLRCVLVRMTPKAQRLLDKLVQKRIEELRLTGDELVRSLSIVAGVPSWPLAQEGQAVRPAGIGR